MISWLVIGVLIIVALIAIKIGHLRHRIFIILLILFAIFLYISMTMVSTTNQLDLKSSEGVFHSLKVYTGWLANGFQNAKVLAGKAIKMDWTSTNGSFLDKAPLQNQDKET
ncbi:MAG: hypothetical protein ABIH37_05895 [archaeon]